MHRNSTKANCPVKLNRNPLKSLLYLACRAFFVRDDLNLESNMKTCTGKPLKTAFCIQLQSTTQKGGIKMFCLVVAFLSLVIKVPYDWDAYYSGKLDISHSIPFPKQNAL